MILPIFVPDPLAGWSEVWTFALTYDGYSRRGGNREVARLANAVAKRWQETQALPSDSADLRTALFFEQRRHHHYGWPPQGAAET